MNKIEPKKGESQMAFIERAVSANAKASEINTLRSKAFHCQVYRTFKGEAVTKEELMTELMVNKELLKEVLEEDGFRIELPTEHITNQPE